MDYWNNGNVFTEKRVADGLSIQSRAEDFSNLLHLYKLGAISIDKLLNNEAGKWFCRRNNISKEELRSNLQKLENLQNELKSEIETVKLLHSEFKSGIETVTLLHGEFKSGMQAVNGLQRELECRIRYLKPGEKESYLEGLKH